MANYPVLSFNTGYLSPQVDARSDVDKYKSGCRILENMIPRIYGSAERRPGTKYITSLRHPETPGRLIPFVYSNTISYIVLLEPYEMRFFYDGGVVLDSSGRELIVSTPYAAADLFQIQYKQSNDVMWLVHPDYAPYKLSRTSANSFSLDAITFTNGPFKTRNDLAVEDGITLAPSVTTGSGTLTASSAVFDAGHVGALFQITQPRSTVEEGGFQTGIASPGAMVGNPILVEGDYTWTTHGTWIGKIRLERSYDYHKGGTTWEVVKTQDSRNDANVQHAGTEEEDNIYYRIWVEEILSGSVDTYIRCDSSTQSGICRVTGYTSETQVSMTVLKDFASTDADERWAEGCWSPYRGYPRTCTFFEERCVYAGTPHQPQTVWLSASGEFENFEACTKDDASFSLTMSSDYRNAIQWISGVESILIGTTGGEWRLWSGADDVPLTPTNYTMKPQSSYGSTDIQALPVGDVVLFVDFVARKIREMTYSGDKYKYVAPDLTKLAENITETGITSITYQKNPDPMLWCTLVDGTLISLTYDREQDVVAWAEHPFESSPRTQDVELPTDYPTLRVAASTEAPSLNQGKAIYNLDDLLAINNDLAGNYYLANDIDASEAASWNGGTGWWPIGLSHTIALHSGGTPYYTLAGAFTGTLDGNGYTIRNLTISRLGPAGLFADIEGTIANLNLEIEFDASYGGGFAMQTLRTVAGNQPRCYNCHVTGAFVVETAHPIGNIGGFAGYISGRNSTTTGPAMYYDCSATVSISGNDIHGQPGSTIGFGGFVGTTDGYMRFYNCSASGDIDLHASTLAYAINNVGGFVGYATDSAGYFYDCHATGDVKGDSYVGGFVGLTDNNQTIQRCYATGNVITYVGRGGGFGGQLNAVVRDCYARGNVTVAGDYCGGFAGGTVSGYYRQVYCTGALTGGVVGGLVGTESGVGSAAYCYWDTQTTGTSDTAEGMGAEGRSTNTLKKKSTYPSAWDFDDVWYMTESYAHKHSVESVASIVAASEDELWITTARYINGSLVRFVEQFQPRYVTDQEDMWFVDCGLDYDASATDEFSGLSHLEGETVAILGDGAVFPNQVVTNGSITLSENVSRAIVGLPFTYKLKPMRFDLTSSKGTTKGSIKRVAEIVISFYRSLNVHYGKDEDHLYPIEFRTTENVGEPPDLYTGDKVVHHAGGFDVEDSILIMDSGPMPCTIRAIVPRLEQTGR